jgi:hypothetical protein
MEADQFGRPRRRFAANATRPLSRFADAFPVAPQSFWHRTAKKKPSTCAAPPSWQRRVREAPGPIARLISVLRCRRSPSSVRRKARRLIAKRNYNWWRIMESTGWYRVKRRVR